jgi:hypothetical protein
MTEADLATCTTEDLEAGAAMFDRVMTGGCQNCGKQAGQGCNCVFVDPNQPGKTVIGFENG